MLKGKAYQDAVTKLKPLQLADKAEYSGTNALGNAVRIHLEHSFSIPDTYNNKKFEVQDSEDDEDD